MWYSILKCVDVGIFRYLKQYSEVSITRMSLALNLTRRFSNVCFRCVHTGTNNSLQTSRTKWRVLKYGSITATTGALVYYYSLNHQQRRLYKVTLSGITRFVRSSSICAIISMDYWWSLLNMTEGSDEYEDEINKVHQRAADRILHGCLNNGGLYIKLGQGLVSMDHVLPKEYLVTLKALQDKCLKRRKGEVEQLFLEDFGKPHMEIFKSFDEEPIAAASLAQVFKAETKDGTKVAVKAQYIDLQDRFAGDVATVQLLLKIAGFIFPKFDFEWVLIELRDTLEQELDFLHEGQNAERCAKELKHLSFVYVPKINWELSSKRVLTAEYIDGIKINEKEKLVQSGFALADIDYKLFKAFSEQIFHTGFVHADPHPGNVLVRKGVDKKAQLVLLDHGLYEFMPSSIRQSLCNLWKSIVLNDHPRMKKYSTELGVEDYKMLAEMITQRPLRTNNWTLGIKLSPEEIQYLTQAAKHHFDKVMVVLRAMPNTMILVIRNINTIRSIARSHGDPVDRYTVMARSATQGAFVSEKSGILGKLAGLKGRIYFETKLWWDGVRVWFIRITMKSMSFLGMIPDMQQLMGLNSSSSSFSHH